MYLTDAKKEEIREKLGRLLNEQIRGVTLSKALLREEISRASLLDAAVDCREKEFAGNRLHRGILSLNEVLAALFRLEGGAYGKCLRCGRAIAEGRLNVIPQARFCIGCQEKCAAGNPGFFEKFSMVDDLRTLVIFADRMFFYDPSRRKP
jgi:DnaK suppressor protein